MEIESISELIDECARLNIPFAAYAYPGSKDFSFAHSYPDEDTGENNLIGLPPHKDYVEVAMFNQENIYPIGIPIGHDKLPATSLLADLPALEPADIMPMKRSTSRLLHAAQVHQIVNRLKKARGGKVVLSKLVVGKTKGCSVSDFAREYFNSLPDTFRFIYFTQETGLWVGATPELLIDYDVESKRFSIMSLAGTREVSDEPWDGKNIEEQQYVTDFITGVLAQAGATEVEASEPGNRRFGHIEHICTTVTGRYEGNPHVLISSLSPTPAVAGFPRDAALRDIYNFEIHPRNCYAGYIAVKEGSRLRAYVNLRSAFLYPLKDEQNTIIYNIYVGGGITSRSIPAQEWAETEAKASVMESIIEKNGIIK